MFSLRAVLAAASFVLSSASAALMSQVFLGRLFVTAGGEDDEHEKSDSNEADPARTAASSAAGTAPTPTPDANAPASVVVAPAAEPDTTTAKPTLIDTELDIALAAFSEMFEGLARVEQERLDREAEWDAQREDVYTQVHDLVATLAELWTAEVPAVSA